MARTTVDLDDELLERAMKATGAKTKTALLELGLRELLAKSAREQLMASFGSEPGAKAPPRRRPRSFTNS